MRVGAAIGHPVRLRLATHFMTFEKSIGPFVGEGEGIVEAATPPGEGWHWFGGENDGKIHGPLRITGIYLDKGDKADSGEVELIDIRVESSYLRAQACSIMTEVRPSPEGAQFVAAARSLLDKPLDASVDWVVRDWDGKILHESKQPDHAPCRARCRWSAGFLCRLASMVSSKPRRH